MDSYRKQFAVSKRGGWKRTNGAKKGKSQPTDRQIVHRSVRRKLRAEVRVEAE